MNKFCTNCKHFVNSSSSTCSECDSMEKWEARFPAEKVYITTARGGGKNSYSEMWRRWVNMNCNSVYGKCGQYGYIDTDTMKGENNMHDAIARLRLDNSATLVIDGRYYPVKIDSITENVGEPLKFAGREATPGECYVQNDIYAGLVRANASKLFLDIMERRINRIENRTLLPEIKKVHFSGPVTAVIWADGTKTLVRCTNEDIDYEKGLAMAIAKKAFGTNESGGNYYDVFKKFLPKPEADE